MTSVAFLCRRNVIGSLAARNVAVVATATIADNIAVIHVRHRGKGAGIAVAVFTRVTAGNVRVALADKPNASVAAGAVLRDARVIEFHRIPALCAAMTHIAFQRRAHMLRCHAIGDDPIVALAALPKDFVVIDKVDWRPKRAAVMTSFATVGGGKMVFAFAG